MKFFIALLLLSASPLGAGEKIIPSASLPLEFQFLIEGIQTYPATPAEEAKLKETLEALEKNFKKIPQKFLYFIIKTEIYKGVLGRPLEKSQENAKIDQRGLHLLSKKLSENFQIYHSFSRWLIESLQSDIWDLSSEGQAKGARRPTPGYERAQKKIQILRPWYELILLSDAPAFNQKLKPILQEILERILFSTNLFIQFSRFKNDALVSPSGELKYFNFVAQEKPHKAHDPHETFLEFTQYQEQKKSEALKIVQGLEMEKTEEEGSAGEKNPASSEPPMESGEKADQNWKPQ